MRMWPLGAMPNGEALPSPMRGAEGSEPGETRGPRTAGLTILIAEDDKVVQAIVERMLGTAGYEVVTVDDGGAALEVIEERGHEIDLFLADVVLPKISGAEVAAFAVEHFQEMAVLFISGYPQDESQTGRSRFPNSWFLAKPFTPEELLMTVRVLVDARGEENPFGPGEGA